VPYPDGLNVRKAGQEDAESLAVLDAEHCRHYSAPPVFMTVRYGESAASFHAFLSQERNSVWLAEDGATPVGFIRYDAYEFGGSSVTESDQGVFISGAYVRPAYRGRRVAAALADAALRDYATQGLSYCALDYEAFNPQAASFWPRYFFPVCYSVIRWPEA
jgi:ribosomal protein S18 acetylase RimI-like enzyme